MTHKLMGMLTAIVVVLGLSVAMPEDAKKTLGPSKQCPLETFVAREGIKDTAVKACPLCQMMTDCASPAAWILGKKDQLTLSAEQVKKLKKLDADFRQNQADREAKIIKSRASINEVFSKDKWTPRDLKSALKDNANANIKSIIGWANAKDDSMGVLTEEQRTKVMAMTCPREARAEADKPAPPEKGVETQ